MKTNTHFFIIPRSFLLTTRNISDKIGRENQNMHFIFSNVSFFFENRTVYEIMWKNIVESDRPQYGACEFLAGYLRLQAHSQNI